MLILGGIIKMADDRLKIKERHPGSHYSRGGNGGLSGKAKAWIFGSLGVAAVATVGVTSLVNYVQDKNAEEAAHERRVRDEVNLFNQAQSAFYVENYSDALKLYDRAEDIFPENELDPSFRAQIMEIQARKAILDSAAAIEKAEEARIASLKAQYRDVDPRTGLTPYTIKFGENLWSSVDDYLTVQNLGEGSDSREVSEVWADVYDRLVAEGKNPNHLEVGDVIYFRATEDQRVQAQLNVEESLIEKMSDLLHQDEEEIRSLYNQGHEVLGNAREAMNQNALEDQLTDVTLSYESGNIDDAVSLLLTENILPEDYDVKVNESFSSARAFLTDLKTREDRHESLSELVESKSFETLYQRIQEIGADENLIEDVKGAAELQLERKEKASFKEFLMFIGQEEHDEALACLNECINLYGRRADLKMMTEKDQQALEVNQYLIDEVKGIVVDGLVSEAESLVVARNYEGALDKINSAGKYGANVDLLTQEFQTLINQFRQEDKDSAFVELGKEVSSLLEDEAFQEAKGLIGSSRETFSKSSLDSLEVIVNDIEKGVERRKRRESIINVRATTRAAFDEGDYTFALANLEKGRLLGGDFSELADSLESKFQGMYLDAMNREDYSRARLALLEAGRIVGEEKYQVQLDEVNALKEIDDRFDRGDGFVEVKARENESPWTLSKLWYEHATGTKLDVRFENDFLIPSEDATKLSNFIVRVLEMNNMEDESPYKALDVREEIRLPLFEEKVEESQEEFDERINRLGA